MDDNITGMQMNLFLWAKNREKPDPGRKSQVIDAIEVFGYRRGLAIGARFLREEDGIVVYDPKDPIQISAWREKA